MSRGPSDTGRLERESLDASAQPGVGDASYAILLERLATSPGRHEAARTLARALGADDLLMFLRDRELGVLLPAPGFPQTLPDGRAWRAFLDRCVEAIAAMADESGRHSGEPLRPHMERLRPPGMNEPTEAVGIASGRDTVLVLLGGAPRGDALAAVIPFLPLVVRALEGERTAHVADANARIARDAAARAEALAGSLDATRAALTRALDEVRESRRRLQEQATELQAANEELEAQAEELQAANEVLEEQTDELLSTTSELSRQMAAAVAATQALEEASAEAERAQRLAEDANRSKGEFLAAMSHELRTPLNAIAGHVQLVEMGVHGPITEAQRGALGRVQRSQRHLLALITDVLNFAKLEAGRVEYEINDIPLTAVALEVVSLLEPQAAAKGIVCEVDPTPDVLVRADREKLRQILLNLVSNAVKFTNTGGRVDVSSETAGDQVLVRVRDSGVGIAAERLEQIFEPFVQVDARLTRTREGVGLGLAISLDLARGMDGGLTVESVPGEGSTFTLALPRAAASGDAK